MIRPASSRRPGGVGEPVAALDVGERVEIRRDHGGGRSGAAAKTGEGVGRDRPCQWFVRERVTPERIVLERRRCGLRESEGIVVERVRGTEARGAGLALLEPHLDLVLAEGEPAAVAQRRGGAAADRLSGAVKERAVGGKVGHDPAARAEGDGAVTLGEMPVRIDENPVIILTAADRELAPRHAPCDRHGGVEAADDGENEVRHRLTRRSGPSAPRG